MENLPETVINKIMLYTSHPVADILRASSVFKALEMNNRGSIRGSPFDRGYMDAYHGRCYTPHRIEWQGPHEAEFMNRRTLLITDEQLKEYNAAYFHTSDRKWVRNHVQSWILKRYGYLRIVCIRPLWTLTRQEQNFEDTRPSDYFEDLTSYLDADSDSDSDSDSD